MKAFFIHDEKKQSDMLVVPETDNIVSMSREVMEAFIAVKPDFSTFSGERLNGLPPETLGRVVATRKSESDVCILDESIWKQRMAVHLG